MRAALVKARGAGSDEFGLGVNFLRGRVSSDESRWGSVEVCRPLAGVERELVFLLSTLSPSPSSSSPPNDNNPLAALFFFFFGRCPLILFSALHLAS